MDAAFEVVLPILRPPWTGEASSTLYWTVSEGEQVRVGALKCEREGSVWVGGITQGCVAVGIEDVVIVENVIACYEIFHGRWIIRGHRSIGLKRFSLEF